MDARFAFTAQFWGDRAVVCRAIEDRPGPLVEQQFGEFPTWTQAHNCACKLNEGLDLDPLAVRQIVTSSLLATARVVQEALNSRRAWHDSAAVIQVRATQLRFVLAELALAITFCHAATTLSGSPSLRVLLHAQKALRHSADLLIKHSGADNPQLAEIACRAETLNASLQAVLPSLTSAPSNQPNE
jgi:hypothetical protein